MGGGGGSIASGTLSVRSGRGGIGGVEHAPP